MHTPSRSRPSLVSVRHVFRTLIWPRRGLLLVGLLLIAVNRAAGLVLPGASKFLIDNVIANRDVRLLKIILLVVGGALALQALTGFAQTWLLSVEGQRVIAQLRVRIQKHIVRLPIVFFDDRQTGELVSRIMTDVEGVRNLVGTGVMQLAGGLLTAVASLIILIKLNAVMTLYCVIPVLLFGLVTAKAFSVIRPIFRQRGAINAEVTGRLTESLNGIRVIKGFHAEEREEDVFEEGVNRLFENVKSSLTATSLVTSMGTLLMGLASIIIMGVGGSLILQGRMTVGDFFAFTLYLGFMVSPIIQLSSVGTQITEAFAGLDRMDEILNLEREGREEERTHVLEELKGDITFEDVWFAYQEENFVLQDINLEAPAGTVTALVGSSGSGKTTLAGLAASFRTPTRGIVRVDGIDLSTVVLDSYRRHLGVVLQDEFLFDGTIRDNILFGRPDATEEDLQAAVAAASVREFTDRFQEGLETVIGERGVKLSGGQRQRVAIARALLADPQILVLDEATSNLDTESERYIQASMDRLLRGRTTFVIAHRLSTIRRADQILVIEEGRIVERGTHDDLIEQKGRYHELYTYQARI